MKTLIPLTAIAALAASGLTYAQSSTAAFSTPSGYVTQTLEANTFNVVGLTLQGSVVYSGSFETVSGTRLTDNQASFAPLAARTYIVEITSDANPSVDVEGVIQVVPASGFTSNSITTPDNLGASGVLAGATYTIRLAPTIEEVFGTTTSVLSKGPNGASPVSDVIWYPDGAGGYIRYFIRASDSTVRNALTNAAAPNVPLIFSDGLLVQKRATGNSTLTIVGQVKTSISQVVVISGFNLLGTTFPAGSTLQNIGFEDSISSGPNGASPIADIVWIPTTGGGFDRFYNRTSDRTWRNVVTNALAPADLPLTSAVLLQRRGGTTMVDLNPPSSYSGL